MKKIKAQLALALLISSFLFFSCASDTVTNNNNNDNSPKTISIKVVDLNGVPLSNVYASMNWGPGAYVGSSGMVSFDRIKPPYDLMVYSKPDTIYTIYKGLSSSNPVVPLIGKYGSVNLAQSAVVIISYPGNLSSKHESVELRVVSPTSMITEEGWAGDSISYINFSWSGSGPERGSFCAMIDSGDFSATYKYVGFAKKDTNFVSGFVYMIRLTQNDFSFNPPETSVRLSMPSGTTSYSYSSCVAFNGMAISSSIRAGEGFVSSNELLNLVVPGLMPIPYKIKVFLNISFAGNGEYDYTGYFNPGDNTQIQQQALPQLINPPDYAQGIDIGWPFTHNLTGGVYTITFSKSEYSLHNFVSVVSDSNLLYLPDISFWGFSFKGNQTFLWNAANNVGFSSINEFASDKRFANPQNYNGIIKSSNRHFTTAP